MEQRAYSATHKALHWITAAVVLAMAASGMAYFYEVGGDAAITLHQWLGQALIVVLILRVASRVRQPVGLPADHPRWQNLLARAVHLGLYLLLAVYLATGYVAASALGDNVLVWPVDRVFARSDIGEWLLVTHYNLKWLLLAMVALHIAGALKNSVAFGGAGASRMWFGH